MVDIAVDVLCELMSLCFGLRWMIPGSGSAATCHLVRLTNKFVSTFGLDLGCMSCSRALFGVSEELPVVSNSYTSINDGGKNLNN